MKKINLFIGLLLCGAILWSCEEESTVPLNTDFSDALGSRTRPTIQVGDFSSFVDLSRGVVSRNWIVPSNGEILNANGKDPSSLNIIHVKFDEVGVFQVTLQSTFADPSVTLDTTFSVTVLDFITTKIGYTLSKTDADNGIFTEAIGNIEVEAGSTVYYGDISIGAPDTREWTFQGGTPETSGEEPADTLVAVLYKRLGTFDLELISSRKFPKGKADTVSLEDFITIIPSTKPVEVVEVAENGDGAIQVFFSRGIEASTVLAAGLGSFRLMVDGVETNIESARVDNSDESIVNFTVAENIKNTQTATIEYLGGAGIFSTDSYELDPFGPEDVALYAPNLMAPVDPGFESGTVASWDPIGGNETTGATFSASTEEAFSGGFSLKVEIPNTGVQNNFTVQTIPITTPLEEGKAYAIEFKYKQSVLHNGQWTIRLQPGEAWADNYKAFNCGGAQAWCGDFIADGEWHTRRVLKDVRLDTWDDFKMHIQFIGETDVPIVYYLDDFKVFEIDQ